MVGMAQWTAVDGEDGGADSRGRIVGMVLKITDYGRDCTEDMRGG